VDRRAARRLLDEQLVASGQTRASDEEFRRALTDPDILDTLAFATTPEADFATEAARAIRFHRHLVTGAGRRARRRRTSESSNRLAPPAWWEAESQRRLRVFRVERVQMRVDAGLFRLPAFQLYEHRISTLPDALEGRGDYPGLQSVSEVAPLILGLIQKQREWFRAVVPEPECGWDPDDFVDWEEEIEFPAPSWEQDRRCQREFFLPAGFHAVGHSGPSLDRLHLTSRWVADELGISQAEVLVWALADVPFSIPWLPVRIDHHDNLEGPWTTMTILASSPSATSRQVAAAFKSARDKEAPLRASRPWPQLVATFVSDPHSGAAGLTWQGRYEKFKEIHPQQPYRSMRSFREAFYEQSRKR
jgi:hypothetical protein